MGAEGSVIAEDYWLVHLLLSHQNLCAEPALASCGSSYTMREGTGNVAVNVVAKNMEEGLGLTCIEGNKCLHILWEENTFSNVFPTN